MKHYTYVHQTADTKRIFYVGKGTRKDRAIRKDSRCTHWHNIVNKHGFTAEILAYWDTEQEAFDHEKLLISCFKSMGYKLANKTDGGEGVCGHRHSKETKEKLKLEAKKRMTNPETRAHLSLINTGKKTSKETRLKQSLKLRGVPLSLSHRKALSSSSSYAKKVRCVETGVVFDSFRLAGYSLGLDKNAGCNISSGVKTGKMRYGYHWEIAQ